MARRGLSTGGGPQEASRASSARCTNQALTVLYVPYSLDSGALDVFGRNTVRNSRKVQIQVGVSILYRGFGYPRVTGSVLSSPTPTSALDLKNTHKKLNFAESFGRDSVHVFNMKGCETLSYKNPGYNVSDSNPQSSELAHLGQ